MGFQAAQDAMVLERITSIEKQIDMLAASQCGMSEYFQRQITLRNDAAEESLRAEALESALQAHFGEVLDQFNELDARIEQERREKDMSEADLDDSLKRHLCPGDGCTCPHLGADEDDEPEEVVDVVARKLAVDNRCDKERIARRHQSADLHKEILEGAMDKFTSIHMERQRQCDQKLLTLAEGVKVRCAEIESRLSAFTAIRYPFRGQSKDRKIRQEQSATAARVAF